MEFHFFRGETAFDKGGRRTSHLVELAAVLPSLENNHEQYEEGKRCVKCELYFETTSEEKSRFNEKQVINRSVELSFRSTKYNM